MAGPWNPEDIFGAIIVGGPGEDEQEIGQPVQIANGLVIYGCAALAQVRDAPLRAANDRARRLQPGHPF